MIDYIKGEITELTPASVTLETYGIGYSINISLHTYSALTAKKQAKLYIYESIREDAHVLFGFADKMERDLFLLLISVSGVGPSTARMMFSSLGPRELNVAIAGGDVNTLKTVKGIGAKTAERIIVDLKDKIKANGTESADVLLQVSNSVANTESVSALVMLGFTQQASQKVVNKIVKDKPDSSVEEIIKLALKML